MKKSQKILAFISIAIACFLTVITTVPYSIVRHPMYSGMVIMSIFMPLALGSYFSLIPMLFIIPIIVFRIKGEEKTLLKELEGYKNYCLKTPYKLIPLIW